MPADIDTLEAIAREAKKHSPRCDYTEAFRPERVLALLGVVRAAKYVAYSNGFDAALPEKKESLRTALAALEQLKDRT